MPLTLTPRRVISFDALKCSNSLACSDEIPCSETGTQTNTPTVLTLAPR